MLYEKSEILLTKLKSMHNGILMVTKSYYSFMLTIVK